MTLLTLKVFFEDNHLIVLEKPAGLLSQGENSGDENLVDILRLRFNRSYVGLIHRLDRNTSGLMVVAKRSKAAARLTAALQSGDLQREYLAWVHGTIKAPANWSHQLLKNEKTNTVSVVSSARLNSKLATLSCAPVAWANWSGENFTLLKFILETGRSHQIRVQSAAEGFPLLGDLKYAKNLSENAAVVNQAFGRPALHSHRITFPHPMGAALHSYESSLPEDMARLLNL